MKLLRRVRWSLVGAAAFFLVLAVGAYGWTTQSGYFALLPDNAHPAANVVHAPGGKPPADGSGFYFVDVNELQANLIQKLWAEHLVEGAQLVPDNEVLAPGESDQEHITEDARAMTNSQQTAQVVAERALGNDVPIEKLGAQLLAVAGGFSGRQGRPQAGRHRDRSQRSSGAYGGGSDRGHAAGQAGAIGASDAEAGRERHAHHHRQH